MPSIGLPELAIVLIIALVVFGPKRLPEMGQKLGQALREFRSATSEIRSQIGADEIADSVKDIKSTFSLTGDSPRSAAEVAPDAPAEAVPAAAEPAGGVAAAAAEAPAAVTAAPAGEAPATKTAVAETPATETPTTETPATETPATETPVAESAPVAGPAARGVVPFAAAEGDEGGVEAFGSLKRGSAPSPARTAGD